MTARRVSLALALVAATSGLALARCGDGAADGEAIAAARAAIDAACDCGAPGHRAHVACATRVASARVEAGLLPRSCRGAVHRCAARSVCGRRGAVACCVTRGSRTRCTIRKSAARCVARGGCAGAGPSCCDACGLGACGTTTSTVTTTTVAGATTTLGAGGTTSTTLPEASGCSQLAGGGVEPVACGTTVTCALESAGDTDAFTLSVPAAAALAIEISGPNNPCWDLRDASGTSIRRRCKTDNPQSVASLAEGVYTVVVSESLGRVTSYTLSIQGISEPFPCGTSLELPAPPVTGALQPAGDTDAYQVVSAGGETLHIAISGPLIPCWDLFGPSGGLVKRKCDAAADAGPLAPGTYTVVVRESLDRATTYTLSVDRVAP